MTELVLYLASQRMVKYFSPDTKLSMNLGYSSRLDSRFGLTSIIVIFIGVFAATFCHAFGVSVSGQESISEKRGNPEIISEIRSLLDQILAEYQSENFTGASSLVDEAYLENYNLIKDLLARQDMNLAEEIEIQLRGQLRDQVKGTDPDADIPRLVEDLNSNLNNASAMLANNTENKID